VSSDAKREGWDRDQDGRGIIDESADCFVVRDVQCVKITRARTNTLVQKDKTCIHTYARSNANISTRLKVYNFQRCLQYSTV